MRKMIKQITENVWKFHFGNLGSNCYLIKTQGKNILIDTGGEENRKELISDLKKIEVKLEDINVILLTHMHYDHVGNLELFTKARIYASEEEIVNLRKHPFETVLNENFIEKIIDGISKTPPTAEFIEIGEVKIEPIKDFKVKLLKTIKVPGHTKGSIAFYMPSEKILFSGDTLFDEGIGRTDLPTSQKEKMQESLKKLRKTDYKILCAGH